MDPLHSAWNLTFTSTTAIEAHHSLRLLSVPQVEAIHSRLHKDILHNPVVMLNFCPNLKPVNSDLRKVHGEFIFLIDRSGSMSGVNITRVKVLRSLELLDCYVMHEKELRPFHKTH